MDYCLDKVFVKGKSGVVTVTTKTMTAKVYRMHFYIALLRIMDVIVTAETVMRLRIGLAFEKVVSEDVSGLTGEVEKEEDH